MFSLHDALHSKAEISGGSRISQRKEVPFHVWKGQLALCISGVSTDPPVRMANKPDATGKMSTTRVSLNAQSRYIGLSENKKITTWGSKCFQTKEDDMSFNL